MPGAIRQPPIRVVKFLHLGFDLGELLLSPLLDIYLLGLVLGDDLFLFSSTLAILCFSFSSIFAIFSFGSMFYLFGRRCI